MILHAMTTSVYHHSTNQPPPLEGYDLFTENRPLVEALRREGGGAHEERCAGATPSLLPF